MEETSAPVIGFDYPISSLFRPTRDPRDADGWFASNDFGNELTPVCENGHLFHPADDWNRNDLNDGSETVKAVADGEVEAVRQLKNAEGTKLGQGIAISHKMEDGSPFNALRTASQTATKSTSRGGRPPDHGSSRGGGLWGSSEGFICQCRQ